jgi:hypothetical protein
LRDPAQASADDSTCLLGLADRTLVEVRAFEFVIQDGLEDRHPGVQAFSGGQCLMAKAKHCRLTSFPLPPHGDQLITTFFPIRIF